MLELREKKIGRLVAMIIMEWIKKITDIIMPPGVEEEEEIKKAEIKKEEPPAQVTEKKIEEPKIEPEPLPELRQWSLVSESAEQNSPVLT